jgi:glycosyltransferase involved in cell wall biosynthesis
MGPNIDGIEWKREKWTGLARLILRWSERAAVRWSHVVIADNAAIADHVRDTYQQECHVIPYGGDHALTAPPVAKPGLDLPGDYALALCRIEPENNVAMILEAFERMPDRPLVFVGNWDKSTYGRALRARFGAVPHLHLLDPAYDPGHLRWLRNGARAYVHGHSAGGTNPSLVEMMHFGIPVFAHGCAFNRHTTENRATYFESADDLVSAVQMQDEGQGRENGAAMREIAGRRYTWDSVGQAYFEILEQA